MAGKNRVMQSRPMALRCIDFGAPLKQPFDGFEIAPPSGKNDGRLPIGVELIDICATRNEQAHQFEIALPSADHQPRSGSAPHEIGRQSGIKPGFGLTQVTQFHAMHEGQGRRQSRRRLCWHRQNEAHPDYHCSQIVSD